MANTVALSAALIDGVGGDPTARRRLNLSRIIRASEQAILYNPIDGAVSSQTATVTDSASNDASLTQKYATVFSGALTANLPWNWLGGTPYVCYTSYAAVVPLSEAPGVGNLNGQAADNSLSKLVTVIEFMTDAPVIQFESDTFHESSALGAAGWSLRIGGKPYSTNASIAFGGTGAPRYLKFDFGSRRLRRLRWSAEAPLLRVAIGPADTITALDTKFGIKALWVGDSFERGGNQAAGSTSGVADLRRAMAWAASDLLGWNDVGVAGIGGTGYCNNASTQNTYLQRLTAGPGLVALHGQPEVVVLKSSQNDWTQGYSSSVVTAAALATWQAYRAAFPNALIVVTGLHSQNTGPNSTFTNGEAALLTAFNSWADPFSMFVPISTDVTPWLKGTGKVGSTNGSGSCDFYLGADGSHLAGYAGNEYSARRFANGFRSKLRALANGTLS